MKKPETIEDKKVIIKQLSKMDEFEITKTYHENNELKFEVRKYKLEELDKPHVDLLIGELIKIGELHILNNEWYNVEELEALGVIPIVMKDGVLYQVGGRPYTTLTGKGGVEKYLKYMFDSSGKGILEQIEGVDPKVFEQTHGTLTYKDIENLIKDLNNIKE